MAESVSQNQKIGAGDTAATMTTATRCLCGVWMEEKAARAINPRAFKSSKTNGTPNQGKFFVDEYWMKKAGFSSQEKTLDGGAAFSRGKPSTGQSTAAVRTEVAAKIGQSRLDKLDSNGLIEIHADMSDMPDAAKKHPDTWGFFDGKTVHLVAANLATRPPPPGGSISNVLSDVDFTSYSV